MNEDLPNEIRRDLANDVSMHSFNSISNFLPRNDISMLDLNRTNEQSNMIRDYTMHSLDEFEENGNYL